MNKVQKNYMVSKAMFLALDKAMNAREKQFLAGKGRTETRIYQVEDNAVFDSLNEEFSRLFKKEYAELDEVESALKSAENALIQYGLSLAPVKIKERLRSGMNSISFRDNIIDLVMKLDTQTVPASFRG